MTTPTTPAPELPLVPVLKSGHRSVRCRSLRPGDFVIPGSIAVCCILQSSCKHRRVEVYWIGSGDSESFPWTYLEGGTYLGQGKRRTWWNWLPAFAKQYFSPYSRPHAK